MIPQVLCGFPQVFAVAPAVGLGLWDAVQAQLSSNTTERSSCTRPRQPSLLTGLLFDRDGNPMTPTHAIKNGTRYRYMSPAR